MNATGLHLSDPDWDETAQRTVISLGDGLAKTLCIARVLVANGREIDMAGLDRGIGLFCAKLLDLGPEGGRSMLAQLEALLGEVDALTAALQQFKT